MRSRPRPRLPSVVLALACSTVLTACSDHAPSTLDARGPAARTIEALWWFMFIVSTAVVVVVGALILVAMARRRRSEPPAEEPRWSHRLLFGGGVAVPLLILSVLWVWTLHDLSALSQPVGSGATPGALTIDVVGHQWWWEVRYPSQRIVTANDIHIPAGQPVHLRLTTVDVIHSYWVPQLTGKIDMIPGRTNALTIQADAPGIYRGQCAEFCGLQHAQMIFYVVAETPADFQAWVGRETAAPVTPSDAEALRGQQVFESEPCAACHAIRGTSARGTIGPDLSDFGGRLSIGAGSVPNTPGNLGGWIVDSQSIKPGNEMPPIQLEPDELQALIAYLEGLG